MRKCLFFLLLLDIAAGYAQKPLESYRFKVNADDLQIAKLKTDSIIIILKSRLANAGYGNVTVTYNLIKKEFIVASDTIIAEEFINNWLIKPYKVFFYETYSNRDLLDILLPGPGYKKDSNNKRTFLELLNIDNNSLNDRWASNVGIVKVSDTAAFHKIKKALQKYLPSDCIFAYQKELPSLKSPALQVYALKNNTGKLPVHLLIDWAKNSFDGSGHPTILIHFNKIGAKKFALITTKNISKALAIVVDNIVYSAPFVNSEVEGGNAEIAGIFTAIEAKQFANMLSGGYLPIRLTLIK